MPTTWRSDVRTRLTAVGNEFVAANPSRMLNFYSLRPDSLTSKTPCGFVANIRETVEHTAGVRRRTARTTVYLVDRLWGYDETVDRVDDLGDLFLDFMTARPYAISSNTVVEVVGIDGVELGEGDTSTNFVPAIEVTLEAVIQEGRL